MAFDSLDLRYGLKFCISNKCPSYVPIVGLEVDNLRIPAFLGRFRGDRAQTFNSVDFVSSLTHLQSQLSIFYKVCYKESCEVYFICDY